MGLLILNNFKERVSGIIDKNKASQIIEGIKIQTIDVFNNNDFIIVTAINNEFIDEIEIEIKKMKLKNPIISLKKTSIGHL